MTDTYLTVALQLAGKRLHAPGKTSAWGALVFSVDADLSLSVEWHGREPP